jgi:hypothetical protein
MLTYGEDEQWVGFKPEAVFKNSAQGGNSDMSDSVDFWKIQKKSTKFKKIQSKRTGHDGATVEIRNTKIQPVLAINQPTSPINR